MKQEGLKYFTDINLTILGLFIFFSFFVFLLLRVYVYRRDQIARLEQIPFNDSLSDSPNKNTVVTAEV